MNSVFLNRLRIYLGARNGIPPNPGLVAAQLAELGVQGATLTPSFGLWDGELEPSLVIEILGDVNANTARELAENLRRLHDQSAVLWTLDRAIPHGMETRKAEVTP